MKRLTLILLTAILSVHLPAQNLTDKFGKVSEWEAAMTSYDKDPGLKPFTSTTKGIWLS